MHRALAGIAAAAGLLAAFSGSPYRTAAPAKADVRRLAEAVGHEEDHVTALELAQWIRERRPGLRILDLRSPAEFASYHLPRAERMSIESLPEARLESTETIVLISDGGAHAAQGWVLLRVLGYPNVYFLRGGMAEWMSEVMNPAKPNELTRYFGGTPRIGDEPATISDMRRRGC